MVWWMRGEEVAVNRRVWRLAGTAARIVASWSSNPPEQI
jgi:hypothetical protein